MITNYLVYDDTGKIIEVGAQDYEFLAARVVVGERIYTGIEVFDADTQFIENSAVKDKQPFPFTVSKTQIIADGYDTVTITGVPDGATLEWHDGQTDTITDGLVEMATDLPGTYALKFSAAPYLNQEVAIEAVAAT